jgi:hypothetical protein
MNTLCSENFLQCNLGIKKTVYIDKFSFPVIHTSSTCTERNLPTMKTIFALLRFLYGRVY